MYCTFDASYTVFFDIFDCKIKGLLPAICIYLQTVFPCISFIINFLIENDIFMKAHKTSLLREEQAISHINLDCKSNGMAILHLLLENS